MTKINFYLLKNNSNLKFITYLINSFPSTLALLRQYSDTVVEIYGSAARVRLDVLV